MWVGVRGFPYKSAFVFTLGVGFIWRWGSPEENRD